MEFCQCLSVTVEQFRLVAPAKLLSFHQADKEQEK